MSDSLSQSLSALARTLITFTSRGQEEEHRDQLLAWTPLELSTGLCEILRRLVQKRLLALSQAWPGAGAGPGVAAAAAAPAADSCSAARTELQKMNNIIIR